MKEAGRWWCFLRPVSASREWGAALERNAGLERSRDALQESLDEARRRLTAAIDDLELERGKREKAEDTVRELRQALYEARAEISRLAPELLEAEGLMADVASLRMNLADRERRIVLLRENLEATRQELRRAYGLPGKSDLIDWDESSPEEPRKPQFPAENYPSPESKGTDIGGTMADDDHNDEDGDWLQELPDTGK